MLLGKRPRPPMRRTTSMSGIVPPSDITDSQDPSSDPSAVRVLVIEEPRHDDIPNLVPAASPRGGYGGRAAAGGAFGVGYDCDGFNLEAAHFLETCGLCRRRLFPGRDIYMYRGDAAFCSLECREQLMKQEERKAKNGLRSPRDALDRMD
ncbi:hypothetical protein MLD38_031289 [Melastoma candidum]|uniref:Uncharacterized protein n=1 Tax=Melastoma candidum TaxID=119954 RepID=A0ACB9MP77_9MYRT|nr:hypothetical protein MLD38_031289 [Melastoma candidum]